MIMPELILEKHKDMHDTCLKAIELELLEVNQWEWQFLNSIGEQLSNDKYLSFKQFSCLSKIHGRID